MRLKDFDYKLPEELVAQTPLAQRDSARLMVVNKAGRTITHDSFANIGKYLPPQSLIVMNNSKVVPARLFGNKTRSGGKVELFLLKKLSDGFCYEILMRPQKKIKDGDKITFKGSRLVAHIISKEKKIVRFNKKNILSYLEQVGHIPLPPYIKRPDNKKDRQYYQTVFARHAGSVAAPTAGLHFTKELLGDLRHCGHATAQVTLHINYATFKPVECDDITAHPMHFEEYTLSQNVYDKISLAKKEKRPIVAVGTTSCRVLETVVKEKRLKGRTNLYIYPGYDFKAVDALITNFHLPSSTLLMLVYTLGGIKLMQKAYREAIKHKYRFYSYGDAMIIR